MTVLEPRTFGAAGAIDWWPLCGSCVQAFEDTCAEELRRARVASTVRTRALLRAIALARFLRFLGR